MKTTTVVIGAGHSGLAASQCLTEKSIDHVVLERGEVANSWKKERWDSLRLLTPNWQASLPGYSYEGNDPDGYMDMPQVIDFIESYAEHVSAPVRGETTVTSVAVNGDGYHVSTDQGDWKCRTVVLANGACSQPKVPAVASQVPPSIAMLTPKEYRNPDQLEQGGVMVVGASASGLQIAEEVHCSGRPVTLAVGEHVRLPRMYRGLDILGWMDDAGILDEGYDEVDDITRARNVPSPQLVGTQERHTLDINRLSTLGVQVRGRLSGVSDGRALFSGSLKNVCALADLKMNRLLNTIDEWITQNELENSTPPAERFEPTRVEESPPLIMDLEKSGIRTIVWATGYTPDFGWLHAPVFDHKGRIRHDGGVVAAPGMYLLGTNFLRKRKSSFIHGVEDDARYLTAHLSGFLAG